MLDGELLRGQYSVETFEGEGAFSVEEVRDVSLLEAGLLGEAASGEVASIDSSLEFEPKEFMKVLKVHNGVDPRRTISFSRANIKRKVRLTQ